MRLGKAKRRWIAWCRYVDKTQTVASHRGAYGTGAHDGQIRAYRDVMYARRYAPIGVRAIWYPKWGHPR